jgi:CHAD domain-containing protein
MGYRLKRKERVAKGVRRIVREQLRSAIKAARDRDAAQEERVHEVRTRLKRSRAALLMVRQRVGKAAARDAERLRDTGRRLAHPRDLAVQAHTFRLLGSPRLQRELPPGLLAQLAKAERHLNLELRPKRVERELRRTAKKLRALRDELGGWKVTHGRRAVGKGVTTTYRKARRALDEARRRPSPKRFHDWRKRVKALSYELRIIAGAVPELTTTLVPKVERLAEILGQVHDLDCAKATVAQHPRWFGRGGDGTAVMALVDERRAQLEGEALALAESVFAGRAKDVRSLVEIGWDIWRKRGKRELSDIERRTAAG